MEYTTNKAFLNINVIPNDENVEVYFEEDFKLRYGTNVKHIYIIVEDGSNN